MSVSPDILCIGSVLWDIIGRSPAKMRVGSDVPGRITRLPGGVALNIAMTLAQFGMVPALLSVVGRDVEGDALLSACAAKGLITDFVYRSDDLPTDQYMAIEGADGVIAAIADAHSLEEAGTAILSPLLDGRLPAPYSGSIAVDGNLTVDLLDQIANGSLLADADLRIAPASPGKAVRLRPFLTAGRGTLYVNLEEASLLCGETFASSHEAASGLLAKGAAQVLVTDGADSASFAAQNSDVITKLPPSVQVTRLTGAGDTFMAAHIAAERRGLLPADALGAALIASATYVSGDTPT